MICFIGLNAFKTIQPNPIIDVVFLTPVNLTTMQPCPMYAYTQVRKLRNNWETFSKEIRLAEPEGFSEGSGYISQFIPTGVLLKTLSISKSYTSSIVLCEGNIGKVDSPYWPGSWDYIPPYCPVDKAIQVILFQIGSLIAFLA